MHATPDTASHDERGDAVLSPRAEPGESLCVRVRWGGRCVATHVLSADVQPRLALGAGAQADVVLPMTGRATFEVRGGACRLTFTDGVRGSLTRDGEAVRLGDLVSRGVATEAGEAWCCELQQADAVRLDAGALTVEAVRVRGARRVLASLDDVLDYRFLNVLLVCFFVGLLGVGEATFAKDQADDDGPLDKAALTQLRHVLVRAAPPEKKLVAQRGSEPSSGTSAPEGRPMRTPRPAAGGRATGNSTSAPDARALARSALAGLGTQGVFGSGGLGSALSGALGTVVGSSDGLGGLSLRGNGGGSMGGQLIGLGGIGTSGIGRGGPGGRGEVTLCRGPKESCKEKVDTKIEVGDSHVCTGDGANSCMDKELIRQVIHAHLGQVKYCYESLLGQSPSLNGRVSVAFHVSAGGTVDLARVAASSAQRAELGECLVSRVRTWVFPTNKSMGGYTVTYPFVFRASGT